MTAHTTHPLADAYLRDLELLLHGVDAGDRAEVLAGVREHLDGRLGAQPTEDEVRAALRELGAPQAIADEAYAGRPTMPGAPVASPAPPAPTPVWHAVTATGVNGLGLLFAGLLVLIGPHPLEFLLVGSTFGLPWLLGVTMSAMSPAWRTREKIASVAFFPVLLAALATVTAVAAAAIGYGSPGAFAALVLVVLGAAATLGFLLREALR